MIYDDADWPNGLRCMDCDILFEDGMEYSHRLAGLAEDGTPCVEVVCTPCIMKPVLAA